MGKMIFKNDEVFQLWQHFGEAAQYEIFQFFKNNIHDLELFINSYKQFYEKLDITELTQSSSFDYLKEFNSQIFSLLTKKQNFIQSDIFEKINEEYQKLLNQNIQEQTEILTRNEEFIPFVLIKNDSIAISFQKIRINISYSFSKGRKRWVNGFRKIIKRQPLDLRSFRVREIPFHQMMDYYFSVRVPNMLLEPMHALMKHNSKTLLDLWNFDEALDQSLQNILGKERGSDPLKVMKRDEFDLLFIQFQENQENIIESLKLQIKTAVEEAFIELDEAMLIVDSPDLSTQLFLPSKTNQQKRQISSVFNNELGKWHNTLKSLLDDWASDAEIVLLYYSVLGLHANLNAKIGEFINENLNLNLEQLREFIQSSLKRIESKNAQNVELAKVLREERERTSHELIDGILSKTIEKLSNSINDDLESFTSKTMAQVATISDKRSYLKSRNYEKGAKSAEISWLSPRELISFEALPHFKLALKDIKNSIEQDMEKAKLNLLSMGTVADFSLESAQMLLQKKKGAVKSTVNVVKEGYDRAITHLDESAQLMEAIKNEPLRNLQIAINNFNHEIQLLKNTDNILELNIKIVKLKAIQRSKKMRKDIISWIINMGPKSLDYIKKQSEGTANLILVVKKKLGIKAETAAISHELSEFIRETETALKKLPFVYQRLYQLTPTDEDRFFVNRTKELQELNLAFEHWQKDRFITTAVICEKGGGATSLFSFFLRKLETELSIIHESPDQKITNASEYFQFFAKILDHEPFKTNEEIIHYLNKKSPYKIIIIENLHHFYLKQVNGFDCLRMIFDLMASTNKKVFWAASCTIHSWEYLEKTLKISNHFVKEIFLEKLNEETIENIIFKRNQLSGYKIKFEPSYELMKSKSFIKMNEETAQNYLRKQFFYELTQMSNGNVSLAQLYWLRSTRNVSDDTIRIGSMQEVDVSFVSDLSRESLFIMHAILVHDGLTMSDYSTVVRLPENSCRNQLIPMLEKGLLIRPKEKFNINPIIFRQVVNLLRSHNFIN